MEEICGDTGCRRRSESIAQRLRVGLETTRIIRVADPGAGMRARPPTARLRRVCVYTRTRATANDRKAGDWRRVRACLCLISTRCVCEWERGGRDGRDVMSRGGGQRRRRDSGSWLMRRQRGTGAACLKACMKACVHTHTIDPPTHPPTHTHALSFSLSHAHAHECMHASTHMHAWMDGFFAPLAMVASEVERDDGGDSGGESGGGGGGGGGTHTHT